MPPLVLAILNSLTPSSHKTKLIDDRTTEIDYEGSYDLVALTGMTVNINRVYQISKKFRDKGIKVIIGGIHATALPNEAKEHCDAVAIGEVENIWEQILVDCENNELKDFYRDSDYPDMQKLTIPDWGDLDLSKYLKLKSIKYPTMPICTTRGCVFNCKFCSVTKFFGSKYRIKPIANVLQEIDSIKGAMKYFFVDDNIICNPDYSRELFKELKKRDIKWFSQASTTIMKNPDLIELASESGCTELFFGIESISTGTLSAMNKSFNKIEIYEELAARLQKAKINPYYSFIFGLDQDTEDTFDETLKFCLKNNIFNAFFFLLTPLPGTDLFNEMDKEGRILDRNWSSYTLTDVIFQPKNFTPEQLYEKYWQTYEKYYSSSSIFSRILKNHTIYFRSFRQFISTIVCHQYYHRKICDRKHPLEGGE